MLLLCDHPIIGGVARVIRKANGGSRFQKESSDYVEEHGRLEVGGVWAQRLVFIITKSSLFVKLLGLTLSITLAHVTECHK